jgi:hypothetical protein
MAHRVVTNEAEREAYIRFVQSASLPRTFEDTKGRDRSLDQNRLQFLWAREAAEQRGDVTIDEVRREWKLHHGVPILRAENSSFCDVYDAAIKPLPYERKLLAMRFIAVTSEMSVPQMIAYLDAVQRECLEQGLRITDPDPSLAAYQQRYRQKEAA